MASAPQRSTRAAQPAVAEVPKPRASAGSEQVAIVGLGYVGLPTALSLAWSGIPVLGYDISESRLTAIKAGRVDVSGTDCRRLAEVLDSERLNLTTEPAGLADAQTVLVCVPTPVDEHLVPDLRALRAACDTVVAGARPGQTIVLTSTTYVGCTVDLLVEPLQRRGLNVGKDVYVAFSPERIDPGVAAHSPERTPRVVGGATAECLEHAARVLARSAASIHEVSSLEAAELTKLLENSFRAINIAFANEFADISRQFGVDPTEVVRAAATKPYGFMPFRPGPGVGGHCIPCDPHYLTWQLRAARMSAPIIETAMSRIAARPRLVATRAREVLAEVGVPVAGARVLVVGVAYKPGVADVRESPALEIIDELARHGAHVSYCDPLVDVIRTDSGFMASEVDPAGSQWDLVIAHTVHPGVDRAWLSSAHRVLDATYTLGRSANLWAL